ncbi:DUF2799 domain-containing protein [Enterovibrio sp. ZSDZ35]|uniref:DUF2799 domain-containing protein n=1 Tax=Enterovibrio qingdaonensis TaxID=2899818 RepID=A0ABT5QPT1_9GAMM|nr:DUF2799 domain-containing protein [Enterovibrio sp. ZSDZ35]MDD1782996.1 DUF2799 domain-containing protein [Enterovibrio sp. ZSDZ35]
MLKKSGVLFLAALMVGCAGIEDTTNLVQQGDWTAVGERDGVRGLPSRSMSDLQALAAKAGVDAVNVAEYEQGYNEGVDRYCDVNNAYEIGLSGMQYLGVCANMENGVRFELEWQRGFEDFQSADQTF